VGVAERQVVEQEVCFFSDRTVRQSGAVNFIFATSAQQKKTFGQSFGESFLPMETLGLDTGRFPSFIYCMDSNLPKSTNSKNKYFHYYFLFQRMA
jgi:hypothetical protein